MGVLRFVLEVLKKVGLWFLIALVAILIIPVMFIVISFVLLLLGLDRVSDKKWELFFVGAFLTIVIAFIDFWGANFELEMIVLFKDIFWGFFFSFLFVSALAEDVDSTYSDGDRSTKLLFLIVTSIIFLVLGVFFAFRPDLMIFNYSYPATFFLGLAVGTIAFVDSPWSGATSGFIPGYTLASILAFNLTFFQASLLFLLVYLGVSLGVAIRGLLFPDGLISLLASNLGGAK